MLAILAGYAVISLAGLAVVTASSGSALLVLLAGAAHAGGLRRGGGLGLDRDPSWIANPTGLAAFAGSLGLVVLPLVRFAADQETATFSIFVPTPFSTTSSGGPCRRASAQARWLAERYLGFWDRLCCHPRLDGVDGPA